MAMVPSALGMVARSPANIRQAPRVVQTVVAGGGMAAGTVMRQLGERGIRGKLLVLAKELPWAASVPRHLQLGQSRRGLILDNFEYDPYYLKQKMTAEEFMRRQVEHQTQAVALLPDDADFIETNLARVVRQGRQLLLTGQDGSQVLTDRLFLATGVGPERELSRSGVLIENEVSAKRLVFGEVTTAVRSMENSQEYWRGKSVTIYGGGPTAAWVAEVAMSYGIRDILWISKSGFGGANPGNRNSETLQVTEGHRIVAGVRSLRYRGGVDAPPQSNGLELQLDVTRADWRHKTDIVICATGSDPMAPTGVQSVLGPIYRELMPHVGRQKGVYACTDDGSLFVVSTALTSDATVKSLIEGNTYPVLNAENHVVAGMRVGDLSAKDAVEAAMTPGPSRSSTT